MKVFYDNSGGILKIKLSGDMDDAGIQKIKNQIDGIIETERFYEVVFDFSDVPFMDSTGIGMLLGRYKKLKRINAPMFVAGANAQVDKVFYTSGIYEIIKKVV